MRNLLFTFVLSIGSGFLFAHHNSNGAANNSDLNIKMWDNSNFTIKLDHKVVKRTRSFELKNVRPGRHYLEIIKKKRNRNGNGFFVQTIYKGKINVPSPSILPLIKLPICIDPFAYSSVPFPFLSSFFHSPL